MDPVHDRGSMDLVHESGPWPGSKVGVHGPLVHVLSSTHVIVSYLVYSEDRSWSKQLPALHHQACYINKSSKIRFSN